MTYRERIKILREREDRTYPAEKKRKAAIWTAMITAPFHSRMDIAFTPTTTGDKPYFYGGIGNALNF